MIENQINYLKEKKQMINYQEEALIYAPDFDHLVLKQRSEREIEDELLAEEDSLLQLTRTMELKGLWGKNPILTKKVMEPERKKCHWDFVLDEMIWMANDFAKETKWRIAHAKKISREILRYHASQKAKETRKQKEEQMSIRKIASKISKIVQTEFWGKVTKIIELKNENILKEKKENAMAQKRELIVQHTENISKMITKELGSPGPFMKREGELSDLITSQPQEDDQMVEEFNPDEMEEATDDESTLIEEEKLEENEGGHENEIKSLEDESKLSIEEVLEKYGIKKDPKQNPLDNLRDQESKDQIHAAEMAQPKGFTLNTTEIKHKIPILLNPELKLREYQMIGLNWLITMYEKNLNGILADEMGLGKTVQTIALLAHLAEEKKVWGPHIVIVPASVLINWEIEFKKWAPGLKILPYYGTLKQRKQKRQGWSKPNSFHVLITSYNIAVQDQSILRRKPWHYMILDEAHHIKNFKSKKWQCLLTYPSDHRLLLTGTPLQNSVMELWSLMHFLMPKIFESHSEFKEWFSNPLTGMVEGKQGINEQLIQRLHTILRPFLLRRLKKDVEKQLPGKYEHIIKVELSKRQRTLYEDFMCRTDTKSTLNSGGLFKILGIIMQLRKVCNHPDLFEERPIISPFLSSEIKLEVPKMTHTVLYKDPLENVDLNFIGLNLQSNEKFSTIEKSLIQELELPKNSFDEYVPNMQPLQGNYSKSFHIYDQRVKTKYQQLQQERVNHLYYVNSMKYNPNIIYGNNTIQFLTIEKKESLFHFPNTKKWEEIEILKVKTPEERFEELKKEIETFTFVIPKVSTIHNPKNTFNSPIIIEQENKMEEELTLKSFELFDIYRPGYIRTRMNFPDKKLIQFDCGKLQVLDKLLRELKSKNQKVLVFTQMSKMLNILESFLCFHGHSYLRLDGTTKIEERQYLMEKFNTDPKVFCFILSTRSGGVGVNLTGASAVIFYDSDWNPAMDAQAQDRCHRIGQTKDVHIYRLICKSTIEERILLKATQKRTINDVVIETHGFSPEVLSKMDIREIFDEQFQSNIISTNDKDLEYALTQVEDENDVIALKKAQKEEEEVNQEIEEMEDKDETDGLLPIEKYALKYLETENIAIINQEIQRIEEETELNKQMWLESNKQLQQLEEDHIEENFYHEASKHKHTLF